MAITLTDIETKVREIVGDFSITGRDIFTYGSSAVFTLTESNIVTVDNVSRNDVSSGVTYSFNSSTNKVTVTSSLTSGDTVEVQYTYYNDYSSTEIESYVKAALTYISTNNYKDFIVEGVSDEIHPEPEIKEQNLMALVASILIKPDNRTYRLPDLTIVAPKDLPTDEKISRAIRICKKAVSGVYTII